MVGWLRVQGQPGLHGEFKASLGNLGLRITKYKAVLCRQMAEHVLRHSRPWALYRAPNKSNQTNKRSKMLPKNETLTPGAIWSSNRCTFFVTKSQLSTAPRVDGGVQELGVVLHACNPGTREDFEL